MISQVFLPLKCIEKLFARKWVFTFISYQVYFQTTSKKKFFRTMVARKWLLTCTSSQVWLQMISCIKCLRTFLLKLNSTELSIQSTEGLPSSSLAALLSLPIIPHSPNTLFSFLSFKLRRLSQIVSIELEPVNGSHVCARNWFTLNAISVSTKTFAHFIIFK